jgi:hypothetical protein
MVTGLYARNSLKLLWQFATWIQICIPQADPVSLLTARTAEQIIKQESINLKVQTTGGEHETRSSSNGQAFDA